jgi:hypothetical protein
LEASASRELRSVNRKALIRRKKDQEQQDIIAKLQRYAKMTPEEHALHREEIREVIGRARKIVHSLPDPGDP